MSGRGESTWACITSRVPAILSRLARNFYTPPGGIAVCVRESPLTRVELRRHCSRDNAISRFLADSRIKRFVITSHPKWKTFLARPTSPRDFCAVEYYACGVFQRSPMPASHKCFCQAFLRKSARIVGHRLLPPRLKFNIGREKGPILKKRKQLLRTISSNHFEKKIRNKILC